MTEVTMEERNCIDSVSHKTAEALADAKDLEEVKEELSDFEEEHDTTWKSLGGQDNNYGIIHNQTNSPGPALIEILANSFDANLLKEFDGNSDFSNSHEAAEELLTEEDSVRMRTDGYFGKGPGKSSWNFTVEDDGTGQPQSDFEEMFCGLLKPGQVKQDYSFLQGKFGMGSSGVLRFCEDGYKLIVSSAHDEPEKWSWTLIREARDKNRYEYMTVNGNVPTFEGRFDPGEGLEVKEFGTVVKMYNYELQNSSRITESKFRRQLERWLINPVMPVELIDSRREDSDAHSATCDGFLGRINMDIYQPAVKHNFTITKDFENPELGRKEIQIVTFHSKPDRQELIQEGKLAERHLRMNEFYTSQDDMRVLMHVNGQTHGFFSESPIKTKSELPRTAEDTIVMVDCSELSEAPFSDIFMPSRDRLVDSQVRQDLEEGIFEALKENDTLRQEEVYRRKQMNQSSQMTELNQEAVQEFVGNNPDIAKFFESGDYSGDNSDNNEEETPEPPTEDYTGTLPPTQFNIIERFRSYTDFDVWTELQMFEVELPLNKNRRIRYELNAPNQYFRKERSEFKLSNEKLFDSFSFKNGVLSLRIEAPEDVEVGDEEEVTVQISDTEATTPLRVDFKVNYVEPVDKKSSPSDEANFSLPEMRVIGRDEWVEQRENDEESVVEIIGYEFDNMDIYVHGDSNPYRRFIDSHSINVQHEDAVKERFVQSVYLLTLSSLVDFKTEETDDEIDDEQQNRITERTLRGQSKTLLSVATTKSERNDWSR